MGVFEEAETEREGKEELWWGLNPHQLLAPLLTLLSSTSALTPKKGSSQILVFLLSIPPFQFVTSN